jgi:Xaa-Pro aminopeptidase
MDHRIDKVRSLLRSKDIPALLVSKKENQYYLSGLKSSNCYIVITDDNSYLLTDFRYVEAANDLSGSFEVVLINNEYTVFNFLQELAPSKLALEEKTVTLNFYKELKNSVESSLISGDGIIEEIRTVKDENELTAISKAASLNDLCFEHILNYLRPGISELEIALEIEMFLKKNGAERLAFDTICVSGVRTSLPHGQPSEKLLKRGELVTLDFGCVVDGYCSDMTRTVAIGNISEEQREIYNIVLEAQKTGCKAARAGLSCKELDKLVRDFISDAGFGGEFGHGTGHGVGLEVHEAPTLNPTSDDILVENAVITIEPGIYLPKKFGVRIEDLAIITSSSIINRVRSNKELIII